MQALRNDSPHANDWEPQTTTQNQEVHTQTNRVKPTQAHAQQQGFDLDE